MNEAHYSPFGQYAPLVVRDGEMTEFGLNRPQATTQCRTLLFSLINEVKLTRYFLTMDRSIRPKGHI